MLAPYLPDKGSFIGSGTVPTQHINGNNYGLFLGWNETLVC
jgi:hypothetical protein